MECWNDQITVDSSNNQSAQSCAATDSKYYCSSCLSGACCKEYRQSAVEEKGNDNIPPVASHFSQRMMDFYTESSYQESYDELYSEVKEYVNDSDMYEPSDGEILHRLLFTSTSLKDEPLEVIWESSNEEDEQNGNSDGERSNPEETINANISYNKANGLVWQIENCFLETAHLLNKVNVTSDTSSRGTSHKDSDVTTNPRNDFTPTLSTENINHGHFRVVSDDDEHDYVNISECYSDISDPLYIYDRQPPSTNNQITQQHYESSSTSDLSQLEQTYQNFSSIDYNYNDEIPVMRIDENVIEALFMECFEYSSCEPNTSVDACLRNLENLFHHLRIAKTQIMRSTIDYSFIEKCRNHFNDLLFNEAVTVLNSNQFSFIERAIDRAMLKSRHVTNVNDESPVIGLEGRTHKKIVEEVYPNSNINDNNSNCGDLNSGQQCVPESLPKAEVMTYEDSLELYKDNKELQDSLLSILHSLNDIHDNFLKRRKIEIDSLQNSASSMLKKVISAVAPNVDSVHDYVNFPLEKFSSDEAFMESDAIRQITEISHELKYLWKSYNQTGARSLRRSKSVRDRSRLVINSKLCHSLPNLSILPDRPEFSSCLNIVPHQSPTDRLMSFVLQMKSENRKCYEITLAFLQKIMQKCGIDKDESNDIYQEKPFYPEEPPIDYTKTH